VTVNGFQDRRIRPLCHLSGAKVRVQILVTKNYLKRRIIIFNEVNIEKMFGFYFMAGEY
jgi:hypothetical protein